MTTPMMGDALKCLHDLLMIDPRVTRRVYMIKCRVPDPDDGGTCSAYLDADDCARLAEAFATVASTLATDEQCNDEGGKR